MSIRQTLIDAINAGLTLRCSFKVAAKEWFGEVSLSRISSGFWIDGFTGCVDIVDIDTAVDFFGIVAFNERNMKWFFRHLEERIDFDTESIEYMDDEEIKKLYDDFVQNHFHQQCPHASEFQNKEAIRLMEVMKQEFINIRDEDDEEGDE